MVLFASSFHALDRHFFESFAFYIFFIFRLDVQNYLWLV